MTDKEFEMLLKNSVKEYGHTYEEYPDTEHIFSSGFESRMNAVIRNKKKKSRFAMISFAAAAAAVLLIGVVSARVLINLPSAPENIASAPEEKQLAAVSAGEEESAGKEESSRESITYNNHVRGDEKEDIQMDEAADNDTDEATAEAPAEEEPSEKAKAEEAPADNSIREESAEKKDSAAAARRDTEIYFRGREKALSAGQETAVRAAAGKLLEGGEKKSADVSKKYLDDIYDSGWTVSLEAKPEDNWKTEADRLIVTFTDTEAYLVLRENNKDKVYSISPGAGEIKEIRDIIGGDENE